MPRTYNTRGFFPTGKINEYGFEEQEYRKKPLFKINYMADLHLDYNYNSPFERPNKDDFVAIAGDISGYHDVGYKWLKDNVKQGVFVEGNHIFYNDEYKTLQDLYKRLEEEFPLNSDVSFLQNTYKKVGTVIIFGATLWTDCRFYGYLSSEPLAKYMNDYKYGRYEDNGEIRFLSPYDTIQEHKKSLKALEELSDKYVNDKIVVLTHHCPSAKCISSYYRSSDSNQGYASHLESFIQSHGNIAAWICGHSHYQTSFNIDGCKVVMNSRGYVRYGEDKNFKPKKFILV